MKTRRLPVLSLVLLASLATSGCLHTSNNYEAAENLLPYHRTTDGFRSIRRVVLLPLEVESCSDGMDSLFAASLLREVARRNLFEIIPVSANDMADIQLSDSRATGVYSTRDLIQISQRFGADGALYGVVSHGGFVPRVSFSVRLNLVDCRNGEVVWATDATLDASNRRVSDDAKAYHDEVLASTSSLLGADRMLVSPRLFLGYAASRVADTLSNAQIPVKP